MEFRIDHHFKDNQDLVLQVSENQTAEELSDNRKGIAIFITALMRTMNTLPEYENGNNMLTTIKLVSSLSDAADLYVMYTRAMQHKQ